MIEQGTAEWKALRLGKATASRMADICAKTKTGWSAMRANYAAQLIAERLTGVAAESYTNAAMEWGTATEAEARSVYALVNTAEIAAVDFVPHPSIEMSGASPDGLVGADGLVEVKCPNTATHIDTLLRGTVPEKYILQMQWQMVCTGRQWCDFVSYDPRMPDNLRLFVKRIERDDILITDLEGKVREFLAEVHAKTTALQSDGRMRDEWSGRRIKAYRARGYSPDRIANLIANTHRVTWGYHAHIFIEQRAATILRKQPSATADTAPSQERPGGPSNCP